MKHCAFIATTPTGEMVLAVAHMTPDGTPVIDAVRESIVAGGEAGIDAVYAGLRAQGIEVSDFRRVSAMRPDASNVKELAIAGVLGMVREN